MELLDDVQATELVEMFAKKSRGKNAVIKVIYFRQSILNGTDINIVKQLEDIPLFETGITNPRKIVPVNVFVSCTRAIGNLALKRPRSKFIEAKVFFLELERNEEDDIVLFEEFNGIKELKDLVNSPLSKASAVDEDMSSDSACNTILSTLYPTKSRTLNVSVREIPRGDSFLKICNSTFSFKSESAFRKYKENN